MSSVFDLYDVCCIVGSDSQRKEQSNGGKKIRSQFIENMELKDTLTQTKTSLRVKSERVVLVKTGAILCSKRACSPA